MQGEHPALDRQVLLEELVADPSRLTVVTPNRRLAQSLVAECDARHVAAGHAAWAGADVLPLDALLHRLWDEVLHSEAGASLPLLLSEAQEQAVWEEVVAASGHDLFSAGGAASQCRRAWSLAHEWGIEGRLAAAAAGEDARTFVEWSRRYAHLVQSRGMADAARLPQLLFSLPSLAAARLPARLVLHGFDQLTPRQRAVLEQLRQRGCDIAASSPRPREARVQRRCFDAPRDEWEEMAAWARARLEANPEARIGLVVPDLARHRAAVQRALARVLEPGYLGAAPDAPHPYEVSLGVPLAQVPLVADALAVLRLTGRDIGFEEASRVMRSPFIGAAESEASTRARLDAELRRRLSIETSLEALLRVMSLEKLPNPPRLAQMLGKLAEHRRRALSGKHRAGDWARAFTEALAIMKFPGERGCDSHEHQAWDKWHEVVAAFAALERVAPAMGHGEACARLERLARETLFQPQGHGAPVHVMGVLESAGLEFDHLWVSGLTDEAWPQPARPNPLLPVALQRQGGIPQADAAASLALDRRITRGWLGAAGEVVASHARMQGEGEAGVSALVAHLPEISREALGVPRYPSMRDRVREAGRLERIEDGRGSPAPAEVRGGGTSLFKDQAACPFRAFARLRLGSRALEDIQPGLAPAERGTLLHEMLRATWERLGSRANLEAMAAPQLHALLEAAADEAVAVLRRRRPESMEGRFSAIERGRLVALAREWLALELQRADFEVEALERKVPVTVGGITVNARLDREDRVAGGRAVIDYKTSKRVTVASWLGPRPDEPQLPLYALAGGAQVKLIAFAQVRPGSLQFCGLATEAGLVPKVGTIEANKTRGANQHEDWQALVAHWRREMEGLAAEFLAGDARVSPKAGAKTCNTCDQQLLCRVAEKAPSVAGALGVGEEA